MMIIVPALTEGDQRKDKMVAACIRCVIAAITDLMRQGGDGERHVIQHDGGNHETPDQHLPPIGAEVRSHVCQQLPE